MYYTDRQQGSLKTNKDPNFSLMELTYQLQIPLHTRNDKEIYTNQGGCQEGQTSRYPNKNSVYNYYTGLGEGTYENWVGDILNVELGVGESVGITNTPQYDS